jgi:hypothetical protein
VLATLPPNLSLLCPVVLPPTQEPWEAVRSEMVDDKGLPPAVADKIGEFVVLR